MSSILITGILIASTLGLCPAYHLVGPESYDLLQLKKNNYVTTKL